MSSSRLAGAVNRLLKPLDVMLVRRSSLYAPAGNAWSPQASHQEGTLPPDGLETLRPDHPELVALRREYEESGIPAAVASQWTQEYLQRELDLRYFRGDNVYVWQLRDNNTELSCLLTAWYLRAIDRLGLFDGLKEDGLFGAYTYTLEQDRLVSRDLLDSINEILFLDEALGLASTEGMRILDIGAGYGRLGHRVTTALPGVTSYLCVDAVPESTFISGFYLRHRGVSPRASSIPLTRIEETLKQSGTPQLAVNIHSFSECSRAAVEWWLDLLARHRVPNLFIVPNAEDNGGTRILCKDADGTRTDVLPLLEERGYRRTLLRAKYAAESVQRHGVSPTHYHLFQWS